MDADAAERGLCTLKSRPISVQSCQLTKTSRSGVFLSRGENDAKCLVQGWLRRRPPPRSTLRATKEAFINIITALSQQTVSNLWEEFVNNFSPPVRKMRPLALSAFVVFVVMSLPLVTALPLKQTDERHLPKGGVGLVPAQDEIVGQDLRAKVLLRNRRLIVPAPKLGNTSAGQNRKPDPDDVTTATLVDAYTGDIRRIPPATVVRQQEREHHHRSSSGVVSRRCERKQRNATLALQGCDAVTIDVGVCEGFCHTKANMTGEATFRESDKTYVFPVNTKCKCCRTTYAKQAVKVICQFNVPGGGERKEYTMQVEVVATQGCNCRKCH